MALQPMYPAVNNSVPTLLTALVPASATALPVENPTVLPEGPNLVTLGTEDNAELCFYTAITGNSLTGCIRGFGGTLAQVWPEGTIACRAYTSVDHAAFIANIQALEDGKLAANGNLRDARTSFSAAPLKSNLLTGETLAASLGKLARWYTSFGAGAWAGFGTTATTIAKGNHTHDAYAALDAQGKVAPAAASALAVTVGENRALTLADAGRCLDVEASADVVLTIPPHAQAAFPPGTEIEVTREGTGEVRLVPALGVTLKSVRGVMDAGAQITARYGVVVLKKKGEDDWRVTGEMA